MYPAVIQYEAQTSKHILWRSHGLFANCLSNMQTVTVCHKFGTDYCASSIGPAIIRTHISGVCESMCSDHWSAFIHGTSTTKWWTMFHFSEIVYNFFQFSTQKLSKNTQTSCILVHRSPVGHWINVGVVDDILLIKHYFKLVWQLGSMTWLDETKNR